MERKSLQGQNTLKTKILLNNLKQIDKGDFNQDLECAAPKPWSKYTTPISVKKLTVMW